MPRWAARVDANQGVIVEALRGAGASVQSLAMVGHGCPDVVVGKGGRNWLMEIKDGAKPPSARKLTPDEDRWHDKWRGQVDTVNSPAEALMLVLGSTQVNAA